MSEQLKPCPFCGCAEYSTDDERIRCAKCDACGPVELPGGKWLWNARKRNWVKCSERLPEPEAARLKRKYVPDGSGGQVAVMWRQRFIVAVKDNLEPSLAIFVSGEGVSHFHVIEYPGANVTHWLDEELTLPEDDERPV